MLITCKGEDPQNHMMNHIIRGGRIPNHLMDVPMGRLVCKHQYEEWDDPQFTGLECKGCGRSALLEEDEYYMIKDIPAFEAEFDNQLKVGS
jgi:hypothetical protein